MYKLLLFWCYFLLSENFMFIQNPPVGESDTAVYVNKGAAVVIVFTTRFFLPAFKRIFSRMTVSFNFPAG